MTSSARMQGIKCALLGTLVLPYLGPTPVHAHRFSGALRLFNEVLLTSASEDFMDKEGAFLQALDWDTERLERLGRVGPYLGCAKFGKGRQAFSKLTALLETSKVHRASNSPAQGTCFLVSASPIQADAIRNDLTSNALENFAPLPSVLKVTPGILDHGVSPAHSNRLATSHGYKLHLDNVGGLTVDVSPGIFASHSPEARQFGDDLRQSLISSNLDLRTSVFWADRVIHEHLSYEAGSVRAREWTMAANMIHGLVSEGQNSSVADVCAWDSISIRHGGGRTFKVTGMRHLLPSNETETEETKDLKMACLMGLVSVLAATPEVARVAPLHRSSVLNGVAASISEMASTNMSDTPLRKAGLDGLGEVIQIVDTGLDESSCYFVDEDGGEVEHGYYFDEIGFKGDGEHNSDNLETLFNGGDFTFDLSRRKVVQYIRLVRPENPSTQPSYFEYNGETYEWYSASGFGEDTVNGHGTHTAGSAAGSLVEEPAEVMVCDSSSEQLSCIGRCLDEGNITEFLNNGYPDLHTFCDKFDCDGGYWTSSACLGDDVSATLAENAGMARGAKVAVFDTSFDGNSILASEARNGIWEAAEETGSVIHSNSWGGDSFCYLTDDCLDYDSYMYENPEHLLVFAAGNDGALNPEDRGYLCTINTPGIAKNVLTIGASSSGPDRLPSTNSNGWVFDPYTDVFADIDTVAWFSSYGTTNDFRIKPEVVAPGDKLLSAASDGTGELSCMLDGQQGTSMATPIVAGAAAMIRQYFKQENFYLADVMARGFCDSSRTNVFICEAFSPTAATVKAMLVNSAYSLVGATQLSALSGFGRVQLDNVLLLGGEGDKSLFVADARFSSLDDYTVDEYSFSMNSSDGMEFRATLSWIDPPATSLNVVQLMNDLDLTVRSPSGINYTMWGDQLDFTNVLERVVIPASAIAADNGSWIVAVSALSLTGVQPYSLVVTGAFDDESGGVTTFPLTSASDDDSGAALCAVAASFWSVVVAAASALVVAL